MILLTPTGFFMLQGSYCKLCNLRLQVEAWKAYFAIKHHNAEPVLPSGNQPDERYRSQLVEEQKAKNGGKLPTGPQYHPVPIKADIQHEDEPASKKPVKREGETGQTKTDPPSSSKQAGKKEVGKQEPDRKTGQKKPKSDGTSDSVKNPPVKKVQTNPTQTPQNNVKDGGKTRATEAGQKNAPVQPVEGTSGSDNKELKPLKSAMSKMGARSDATGNASHIQFSADVRDDPAVPTAKKSSEMLHDSTQPKALLGKNMSVNEIPGKAEEEPSKAEDGVDPSSQLSPPQ
ncbi:hypothetical protein RvY_00730-1 [Ramazzottius varieornatus]|uniref:Uncharacterized protein n=1 Tax=Ramazzottius varieornatus TaxID=947166 RepID=A0A1D1UEP2_RAMVA|nr:hypothetical protein RvY_00730-1 [Ramazzottius varieornatus]